MNYNPFNFYGGSSQDPTKRGGALGEIPSYMTTTGTPSGFRTSLQYGTRGLPPADAAAAQKQEFGRLGGIQELQTGALQQQQAGLQLRKSQMELADIEEQRRIRSIIDKGPSMVSGAVSPYGNSYDEAVNSTYGKQYLTEKFKTQDELNMARRGPSGFGGFGGFGSWSTPSFPSQGGMG